MSSTEQRVTRAAGLRAAIERGRSNLQSLQYEDGHWCGLLEGDSILESEYILLLHFLDRGGEERARKAAERIRRLQLPEGGWAIYPGGPPEVSASVKAYFVLKLMGDDPEAPHMARARGVVRELGGVDAANTYTHIYLAIFGQFDWERCPAVPPEMMLLPEWAFFNVGAMSSWSRAIFVPLSILWSLKPRVQVPDSAAIPELFLDSPLIRVPPPAEAHARRWRRFFHAADRGLKVLERQRIRPLQRRALRAAESWIRTRTSQTDGLGAVFPSAVNTVMAFCALGYPPDHPDVRSQLDALEKLEVDHGDTLQVQPSLSPVWDTAQAMAAMSATGTPADHPSLWRGAEWLLEREVRQKGDWCAYNPRGPVGGWYFQYANEFYPDCDDTAEVLLALAPLAAGSGEAAERVREARRRGLAWLLSMQNDDGGWAAFDRCCDREALTHVPFADHNAMLDPSCEDITSRVLELLGEEGFGPEHPAVRSGVRFLRDRQEADGTWYGRWGCNYIYGTWLALRGLSRVGEDMEEGRYQRAAAWLREQQNEDGG
ncbi:MAG: squalene--hopene cyclase, partial [Gemmatimonadota bacterium]|nr:squalene--hopene cyclase [Gemmatimonadota bacterium]